MSKFSRKFEKFSFSKTLFHKSFHINFCFRKIFASIFVVAKNLASIFRKKCVRIFLFLQLFVSFFHKNEINTKTKIFISALLVLKEECFFQFAQKCKNYAKIFCFCEKCYENFLGMNNLF
jgi:hypothetical protein